MTLQAMRIWYLACCILVLSQIIALVAAIAIAIAIAAAATATPCIDLPVQIPTLYALLLIL